MNEILNIILNVVFMLGIVGVCAFIFSIIIDAIMSMSDKHKGVYFNQGSKDKKPNDKFMREKDVVVYRIDAPQDNPVEFIDMDKKDMKKANNISAASVIVEDEHDRFIDIDYDKAVEEQKKLQELKMKKDTGPQLTPLESKSKEPASDNDDYDFDQILDEVAKEAVKQLKEEASLSFSPMGVAHEQPKEREKELFDAPEREPFNPSFAPIPSAFNQPQPMIQPQMQMPANMHVMHTGYPQPQFSPIPSAFLPLNDEIKSLKDEIKTLRNEITSSDKNSVNEVREVYAKMVSKELEDYKRALQEKDRELENYKTRESVNEIVSNALGKYGLTKQDNYNKESVFKNTELDSELNELRQAREKYNQEIAELDRIKKEWFGKEQDFIARQHQHESKQLEYALEQSKKKVEEKDQEIAELKRGNMGFNTTYSSPYDRQELDRMRRDWMAKEDELLYEQRQQKIESTRIIDQLNAMLTEAREEISQKENQINTLKIHKEDSTLQRKELDNLKNEWRKKQAELDAMLESVQIDNAKFIEKLTNDLTIYKADIDNKQQEIAELKRINQDYSNEKAELEKLQAEWLQKEQEIIKVQREQREQDNQVIQQLKEDLIASFGLIEKKEKEIVLLRKQKEDATSELLELEQLKQEWTEKEKQLMVVQDRIKTEDKEAIETLTGELEKSKKTIEDLQELANEREKEIVSKEEEIAKMRKEKQDFSHYIKELEKLKQDWKEKQEEINLIENKRQHDKEELISKITSELDQSKAIIKEKEEQIATLKSMQTDYTAQQQELKEMVGSLAKREQELAEIQRSHSYAFKARAEEVAIEMLRRPRGVLSPVLQPKVYQNPIATTTSEKLEPPTKDNENKKPLLDKPLNIAAQNKETSVKTNDSGMNDKDINVTKEKKPTATKNYTVRSEEINNLKKEIKKHTRDKVNKLKTKEKELKIATEKLKKTKEEYFPLLNAKKMYEKDAAAFESLSLKIAKNQMNAKNLSQKEKDELQADLIKVNQLKSSIKENMAKLENSMQKLRQLEHKHIEEMDKVESLKSEVFNLKMTN